MRIKDVSATALTTLGCLAADTESKSPILNDMHAVNTVKQLTEQFGLSVPRKLKSSLITHIALRTRKYDDITKRFLANHPSGTVVNIGCGFDAGFYRSDNGTVNYYDLDLPEIINIKSKIIPATDRYQQIAGSVFDMNWADLNPSNPLLFLAEGVFMYCEERELKSMFNAMNQHFTNYEVFFEVFNREWLTGIKKTIIDIKLQKELRFGKSAQFKFGVEDSDFLEHWDARFKLLEEWSYLDEDHPALGLMKFFRRFESFRKLQWSVRYQFDKHT